MSIVNIQDFTYKHPNREILFENVSMQINEGQKAALVGRNGTGKTTLLKAIYNYNNFSAIKVETEPYFVPQHIEVYNEMSIGEVLGADKKIKAINAITAGDTSQENFDILGDDWDIENELNIALDYWDLKNFDINAKLINLSGGEKVKVFLAGITLNNPKFVILDEPTNHLDYHSREKLYKWIKETSATLLIVSHDRFLLNLLTDIYELSKNKISFYSGNYDSFVQQKEVEHNALMRQIESQRQELKKTKKVQQEVAERRQKQESRGKKSTEKKGLPRIVANARKGFAQNTTADIADKHSKKISEVTNTIHQLQEKADSTQGLKLKIEDSDLHKGKVLAEAIGINYTYGKNLIWKDDLNFIILSGERILIKGNNGSGKTTLIQLITEKREVSKGNLKLADSEYLYLDQNYSLVDLSKTVYEQAQSYNINMPEHEVKTHLARSQFPEETWDKPCNVLSGGEKMKLSLCSLIISNKIPDLLVLDEPTNNIDIDSMAVLSSTIKEFEGTLIIISHDKYFVNEMNINKEIDLIE